jgi:MerR family transcriptional regulator, light-induced transcriptional regulator
MTPASLAQVSIELDQRRMEIAGEVTERHFRRFPQLEAQYGAEGREKCHQDALHHLAHLAQAIGENSAAMFSEYVGWAKVMLGKRRVPAEDLLQYLKTLREVVTEQLPEASAPVAEQFIEAGLARFSDLPEEIPTLIEEGSPFSGLTREYLGFLLKGERHKASQCILDAVQEDGISVRDIYLHVFQTSQHEIGRLWQTNEISIAQEHYCTAATQLIMSQLYPYLFAGKKKTGTMVATCVSGNLHEIGVRIVADFFEMDGWNTFYLGANVPHASVIQTLIERNADLLAISATISYHVAPVRKLIEAVRKEPRCPTVAILVGGHPFNLDPDLWRKVGADGCACDADQAISVANSLRADRRRP